MDDVVALLDLPNDIWTHILDNLVVHDAVMLQSTNKRLFKLCDKKFGWLSPNDNTMRYFAKIGAISCLQYMCDIGVEWYAHTITAAAETGQLETIKFLHQNGCGKSATLNCGACEAAAESGHLECLQYLHEKGFDWSELAFNVAVKARANSLETLKYLHENGCPWRSEILTAAARFNLDCLKYILDFVGSDHIDRYQKELCSSAAWGNNLAALKYLHEAGFPINGSCERAASVGSLECLKYAHEHGGSWGSTIVNAARGGHTECLKYALQNGDNSLVTDINSWYIWSAVDSGNIECVKLVVEHGARCKDNESETAIQTAVRTNNLEILKYLLEVARIPKLNTNHVYMCACGNLSLLKYLHENGFSWDGNNLAWGDEDDTEVEVQPSGTIVFQAVEYQSLPCLKYILERGYKLDTNDMSLCHEAARHNDVEMLKYLIGLGCKNHPSIMAAAARYGAIDVIKHLHKSGTDLNDSVAMSAAKRGHYNVLEYALKHGYGLNTDVCDQVAASGPVKSLKVMRKYGVPFTSNTVLEASVRYYHRTPKTNHDRLMCVRYLHENGCTWTHQECTNVVKDHDLASLKYLHEHGSQWNEETWYQAVKSDYVECLEYLFANGCPQDPRTFDMTRPVKCLAFMQQHNIIPNTKSDQK